MTTNSLTHGRGRRPFFIVPILFILHSTVLSLHYLYSGPSPYASRGFDALWPQVLTIFIAAMFAYKIKTKYWGISIITLAVAGIPLSLIATIPTHTGLLVVSTWTLNFISASLLFAAYRHDSFDLTQLKLARVARFPSWAMMLIFVAVIVGIFLYWSR
jgi:hypothetical protein